jgi:hypothetical protein
MTTRYLLPVRLMLCCAVAPVCAQEWSPPLELLPTLADFVASADTADAPPPLMLESRPLARAVSAPAAALAQTVPQQPPPARPSRGTRLRAGAAGATLADVLAAAAVSGLGPVPALVVMPPTAALTAVAIMR